MEYSQISFFDGAEPYKITKPIRLIELFAGIGAQAKALENLGANFEHYRICEFDKYAVRSYNAIHGTDFSTSDITKISASDLGIVDTDKYEYIMTYSFPCQDLSSAGKQKGMEKGSGTRSGLLWEVERLLRECAELPQVLLMENVPEVIGAKNIAHFADWIKFLESKGYKNYWQLLNAKDYGIPQNRKRCFMVSLLGGWLYDFPAGEQLYLRLKDVLETEVDEKYYLNEKALRYIEPRIGNYVKLCKLNEIAKTAITAKGNANWTGNFVKLPLAYDEQNQRIRTDGTVGTLTTDGSTPKHNNRVIIPIECQQAGILVGGKWDKMHDIGKRVYSGNGLAPTIHTYGGGNLEPKVLENCRVRKLTPRECFRLMGFDDADFDRAQAVNSNSQLYKQAGNSIVVNVLEAIFKRLL